MEPIDGEVIASQPEDNDLSDYIDKVTTYGFPLGLMARTLCVLKACAYAAVVALVGMLGVMFFHISMDFMSSMYIFGGIMLLFDVLLWVSALYCAIMALVNILAALIGVMPMNQRQMNDNAEGIR